MRNRHVRMAVLAALSSASALATVNATAGDIAFDGSLPGTRAGTLNAVNGIYNIGQNRGFLNGTNLFHSFDVFNLDAEETAIFSGNAAITNIISRVTGGIPTTIDGTIRSTINGANFWFVNPAGLTVGPTGAIDVSGAIALGAADFIDFANGERFMALLDGDDVGVSLSMSAPVDFGFLEGALAGELRIESSQLLSRTVSTSQNQIQPVADGQSFAMLLSGGSGVFLETDGNIELHAARIRTGGDFAAGNIEMRAGGSINLSGSDLLTSAPVDGFGGGDIFIQGGELVTISGSSVVAQSVDAFASTGSITIAGSGVLINDYSQVALDFRAADGGSAGIGAGTISIGTTGTSEELAPHTNLTMATEGVVRIVDSKVSTSSTGSQSIQGVSVGRAFVETPDGEDLDLDATHVVIVGSELSADAIDGSVGRIEISAGTMVHLEDSTLTTSATALDPNQVTVSDAEVTGIRLSAGGGGDFFPEEPGPIELGSLSIQNSVLRANASNNGSPTAPAIGANAAPIELLGGTISLSNSTLESAATGANSGAGGAISLLGGSIDVSSSTLNVASETLNPDVDAVPGDGSSIRMEASSDISIKSSTLTASTSGVATGGSILAFGATIDVQGSTLQSSTTGTGSAGAINLFAFPLFDDPEEPAEPSLSPFGNGFLRITDSTLATSTGSTPSSAGNIELFASGPIDVVRSSLNVSVTADPNALPDTPTDPNLPPGFPRPGGINPTSFASIDLTALGQPITITDSTLQANTSGLIDGGAIFLEGSGFQIRNSSITASSSAPADGTVIDPDMNSTNPRASAGAITLSFSEDSLGDASDDIDVEELNLAFDIDNSVIATNAAATNGGDVVISGFESLSLRNSMVLASAGGVGLGGDILINGLSLDVTNSQIQAAAEMGQGGSIRVFTSATNIQNSSIATNATAAAGGDITIDTLGEVLRLQDSSIVASAGGSGMGGDITLSSLGAGSVLQNSQVQALAANGSGGTISLEVFDGTGSTLQILDSQVAANATAADGGDIFINAADAQLILRQSSIIASAGGSGVGGDISITEANGVTITNSQVQALASAGSGGLIGVSMAPLATGALQIDGSSITTNADLADGGNIILDAGGNQVTLRGSSVVASAGGSGTGGSIAIRNAGSALLQDSQVQALADAGSGGTITLDLSDDSSGPVSLSNSSIRSNALSSNGGNISIDASNQRVSLQNSDIVASAGGTGTGGGITISNAAGTSLQDSRIQALAAAGAGGTINISQAVGASGGVTLDNSSITTNATTADGGNITLDAAGNQVRLRSSSVVASAGGNGTGGSIAIRNAGSALLQDSQVQALADAGSGGTITLDLSDSSSGPVSLSNSSIRSNALSSNGGNISIDASNQRVSLQNSDIVASAGGTGTGGGITISNAAGTSLQDSRIQALAAAGAGGTINISQAVGASGGVTLDNSSIMTNATAANGGNITLDAAGKAVTLSNSMIVASAGGSGVGGGISITNAGAATLTGSQVQALANAGAGGTINLALTAGQSGSLVLDNSSITTNATSANGGNITLDAAGHQVLLRNASIVASAGGNGAGGDISIRNAGGATLQGTQIQALANAGTGGTISIDVQAGTGTVLLQRSNITTNAVAAGGGDITLDAGGNPLLLRDSTILASAGAAGTGGNILLDDLGRTIMQRSQILARADAGNGGTITLNLTPGALFLRDAQSTLSADSNTGNDGQVAINSPDTDLNPAVKLQDAALGETPELSANGCAPVADTARSTFVRDSRGGVSPSPDNYLVSIQGNAAPQASAAAPLARPATTEGEQRVALLAPAGNVQGCSGL